MLHKDPAVFPPYRRLWGLLWHSMEHTSLSGLSRSLPLVGLVSLCVVTQTQPAKRCNVLQRVGSGMCSSFSGLDHGQRGYYRRLGSGGGIKKEGLHKHAGQIDLSFSLVCHAAPTCRLWRAQHMPLSPVKHITYVVGVNWCSLSARHVRVVRADWEVYMVSFCGISEWPWRRYFGH